VRQINIVEPRAGFRGGGRGPRAPGLPPAKSGPGRTAVEKTFLTDIAVAAPTIDYDDKFKSAQQLKAGATQVIPVKVTGIPTPTVDWSLNDQQLTASPTVIIETSAETGQSTLTLKSLTGRFTGKVTITATNAVGKASAEFQITVKGKLSPVHDRPESRSPTTFVCVFAKC